MALTFKILQISSARLFALNGVMPVSSYPSLSFCLVSRVISLNTRGGIWSRPVWMALSPRSKSGNFLTMCFQNSSCHQVSFFLLPIISLVLSLPSSVRGTKQRGCRLCCPTRGNLSRQNTTTVATLYGACCNSGCYLLHKGITH